MASIAESIPQISRPSVTVNDLLQVSGCRLATCFHKLLPKRFFFFFNSQGDASQRPSWFTGIMMKLMRCISILFNVRALTTFYFEKKKRKKQTKKNNLNDRIVSLRPSVTQSRRGDSWMGASGRLSPTHSF